MSMTSNLTGLMIFTGTMMIFLYHMRQLEERERRSIGKKRVSFREDPVVLKISDAVTVHKALIEKFPSLFTATTPVIGLYFCAGWCPDCREATPGLEKVIKCQIATGKLLEVFYVSSDESEEGMKNYKPQIFSEIPFAEEEERIALRKHFGTCAKKEMELLGISGDQRKHGLPTLVLIEASSGKVLAEIEENLCMISEDPEKTLNEWKSLLSSSSQ